MKHISLKRPLFRSIFLWLLLIGFAAFISVWFVSSERFFYFWDYISYMNTAVDLSRTFVHAPLQALEDAYLSMIQDYNSYFALPLIPFLIIFQFSRLGYILGLVFAYHVPVLIVCGSIVRKVFPSVPYAGWLTIFVGLFIPALWASMYRGFPDTGALLLLLLAVLVYLNDMELRQWKFQLPVIGMLSALAVVFRRHFAYSTVSFLFSVGCFLLFPILQSAVKDWKRFLQILMHILVKMLVIFAFFLLTIILLAPSIILKVTSINYLDLYSSYAYEPIQVFTYFIAAYGVLFLLAGFGYLAGLKKVQSFIGLDTGMMMSRTLCFVLFFGVTSFLMWVLIPRQIDVHYVFHIAPMIVVGLGTVIITVLLTIKTPGGRLVVISSISVVMAYTLWAGLAPAKRVHLSTSINYPPLYRSDFDEVIRLVDYLRSLSGRTGSIYVVDSSSVMNNKIIYYAEVYKYGTSSQLQVLNSPQVDSRDYYPLNPILRADYVLVSTPFQYHLKESEQEVVKYTFDAFREQWAITKDFKILPERFHLAEGVVLSVYERQSPTSLETVLSTFSQMKEYVERMPGLQSDWVLTNPVPGRMVVSQTSLRRFSLEISNELPPLLFLYVNEDARGVLSGQVTSSATQCALADVTVEFYEASGAFSLIYAEKLDTMNGEFNWNVKIPNGTFFVLRIESELNSAQLACDQTVTWELLR